MKILIEFNLDKPDIDDQLMGVSGQLYLGELDVFVCSTDRVGEACFWFDKYSKANESRAIRAVKETGVTIRSVTREKED